MTERESGLTGADISELRIFEAAEEAADTARAIMEKRDAPPNVCLAAEAAAVGAICAKASEPMI